MLKSDSVKLVPIPMLLLKRKSTKKYIERREGREQEKEKKRREAS